MLPTAHAPLTQLGCMRQIATLCDPDAVGNVDLGDGLPENAPIQGRDEIAPNLLRFFGPKARVSLVSQPINGHPGVLAFRNQKSVAILQIETRDGRIHDMHAIADPRKLAVISAQFPTPRP